VAVQTTSVQHEVKN